MDEQHMYDTAVYIDQFPLVFTLYVQVIMLLEPQKTT